MRSVSSLLRAVHAAALLCAAAAIVPAAAYESEGEQYYADSFGNLVIVSLAGYKRIIVGKGHVVAQYEAQRARDPEVVYGDDDRGEVYSHARCRIEPGIFYGRSYMYGLPDGVVPTPARKVCD